MSFSAASIKEHISTLPPVSQWATLALLGFSLIQRSPLGLPLIIVPRNILYSPWTLLTSAWTETRLLSLIFSLLMIPFVVQFMYRQWGTPETLKVVILIPLLTNVLGVGLWWLVYAISARMAGYLFPGGLRGPEVILMGALVAYAQTNPDASINLFLFVPVRVKNIPFFQFVVGIVVLLVDGEYPWLLSQLGFYVSWLYLRFYQKRQVNTISSAEFIGDSSDSFALEMWFPEPVRRVITPFTDGAFRIATSLHLINQTAADPLGHVGGVRLGSDEPPSTLSRIGSSISGALSAFFGLFRRGGVQLADEEARAPLIHNGQEESAAARRGRVLHAVDNRLASSHTPVPPPERGSDPPVYTDVPDFRDGDHKPPSPAQS